MRPLGSPVRPLDMELPLSPNAAYILGSGGKFSSSNHAVATLARDSYPKRLKLE
jgi:hypothetical protein